MMLSNDEESLAQFLESEILSEDAGEADEPEAKRPRLGLGGGGGNGAGSSADNDESNSSRNRTVVPKRIDSGVFSKLPPELFPHILKFLPSERDEEDMIELVRNCQSEFKEYYIQMQAAKRSQAPLPSQVNDDRIILDKTVADQVSMWKTSKGFTDKVVLNHACSGETCSYNRIGDVYVCEKTGHVHVCDETCRELVMDPANELLVCTISGHCFDRLLSPAEMEPDNFQDQQTGGVTDEAEPFMGSGRFARAYLLGYNCTDEKELDAVLRFC
ncbi:hypothetical protein CDL15_Pgr028772 [Punica granatum]|uniref:F-box protein SKIP31-like n=1 Tax=Punica granatum TaxID=22663 RepID=A0A218VWV1_PUNGR|nr:hypothetical protein CDL15_Pgr028772 [Punica granatum]